MSSRAAQAADSTPRGPTHPAGDDDLARSAAGRAALVVALGSARWLANRSGRRPRPHRGAVDRLAAAVIALMGPLAAVIPVARRFPLRWQLPQSPAGRVMLVAFTLESALAEELLWRAPLLQLRSRALAVGASASVAGFTGLHLRRDGVVSARIHLVNTVAWTAATLVDGRIRSAVVAHTVHNLLAVGLAADDVAPGGTVS